MSTIDIIFGELKVVTKGVVNMSLGCKVHYCVNGLSDEKEVDKVSTANVSLDKLKVRG